MKNIKIFYKFLIVMIVISALPVALVGNRLIDINRAALENTILELHPREALAIAEFTDEYMRNLIAKIRFAISAHGEGTINLPLTSRIFKSLIASSPEFRSVAVVNYPGDEVKVFHSDLSDTARLENLSEHPTFLQALETGSYSVSRVYYYEGDPQIDIVYPFTSHIYLFIQASLRDLKERVNETRIGSTGFAYIVDTEGRLIMHPDSEYAAKLRDISDSPMVEDARGRRLVGSKEYLKEDGREVIGAHAPSSALNWRVVIEQDKEEAYFTVNHMRRSANSILLGAILFAVFIGYLLAQSLSRPVLKLTGAAKNISGGSFEVNQISDWLKKVRVKDELAELASTFIIMAEQLKSCSDIQTDKLNAVIYSINSGIILTDYSGNIIIANHRVYSLLGLPYEENISGKNIKEIIDQKEVIESLEEVRDTEKTIVKHIDLSDKKMPKFLRFDTSLVSNPTGAVIIIRDITPEKLKEDLVYSITHDLRSPMTSIRGFLELLMAGSAGDLTEQQKEFLQIIDDSSKQLLNMIDNILDVAKMESGTMPMDKEEINLAEEAESALRALEGQAVKDQVEMIIQLENEIGPVMADRGLIYRVITNLVSNSLKFTPKGGLICVSVEDFGGEVEVAVRDTGQGMPEEYVEKIFNKYEQVKGSSGKRKGTGLGLAITKLIIEAHGGTIWAESKLGEGSKFAFRIPKGL